MGGCCAYSCSTISPLSQSKGRKPQEPHKRCSLKTQCHVEALKACCVPPEGKIPMWKQPWFVFCYHFTVSAATQTPGKSGLKTKSILPFAPPISRLPDLHPWLLVYQAKAMWRMPNIPEENTTSRYRASGYIGKQAVNNVKLFSYLATTVQAGIVARSLRKGRGKHKSIEAGIS